jgi:hypothetical protein
MMRLPKCDLAGGPILTFTTRTSGESAHKIKSWWENLTALSVRFYPLVPSVGTGVTGRNGWSRDILASAGVRIDGMVIPSTSDTDYPRGSLSRRANMHHVMGDLRLGGMAIRYSQFVPKLYNYCLSLGFERSRMMPSRAFCSDESQGYPVILIAQHFGTFPFDHGVVGGKVATDRHGPHADHGEDLVIIQASHVGYDADRQRFGVYQRQRTAHGEFGANCGKMAAVLDWYQQEYRHARNQVQLGAVDGAPAVFIDNALLDSDRAEGLILQLDRLIDFAQPDPLRVLATSKAFAAAPSLVALRPEADWQGTRRPIGELLTADLFFFRHQPVVGPEGHDLLEEAIASEMPTLVTSANPALDAARYHTQIEFDRTYRSIQREPA